MSGTWNTLKNTFLAGSLVILPLAVTLWVGVAITGTVDGFLDWLPPTVHPEHLLGFKIPGLGILITVLGVLAVGMVMRYYTARRVVELYESVIHRVPILSPVYQGLKQLFSTLFIEKTDQFRQVVLVEYPRPKVWALAFLTGDVEHLGGSMAGQDLISVFLPTTPNPTSGFYLMVPRADVMLMDVTVEEAFKLIMSAGVVAPAGPRDVVPGDSVYLLDPSKGRPPEIANS